MKYEDFKVKSLNEIEELLNADKIEDIVKGMVSLNYCDEGANRFLRKLLKFVKHNNFWVAKNAITKLGNIYKNNKKINAQEILNLFEKINRPELQPYIIEAIEDINIFQHKRKQN